jgi:hypothetical protein
MISLCLALSFDVLNLEVIFSHETQAVQIICVVRLDRTFVGDGWRKKKYMQVFVTTDRSSRPHS